MYIYIYKIMYNIYIYINICIYIYIYIYIRIYTGIFRQEILLVFAAVIITGTFGGNCY